MTADNTEILSLSMTCEGDQWFVEIATTNELVAKHPVSSVEVGMRVIHMLRAKGLELGMEWLKTAEGGHA